MRNLALVLLSGLLWACTPNTQPINPNILQESNLPTTVIESPTIPQGNYFAYPFEDKGLPEVQPAGMTKLENKNGCLGLSDDYLIVFPSGVTHWSDEKQVLVIRGHEFKVGDWIFSNGFSTHIYDENKPFEFAQIGKPECLKDGMSLRVLRTQIKKLSTNEMKRFAPNLIGK